MKPIYISSLHKHLFCFIFALFFYISIAKKATAGIISTQSTFECISVYYPSEFQGDCRVFYKKTGAPSWKRGLDLVYDDRDIFEYRGSIVNLCSETEYEIKLQTQQTELTTRAKTLSEIFPIGKTTFVKSGHETVTISESGTPDGYHLVTPHPGTRTTLDAGNSADCNILIDADYVVVRGLLLKNAAEHGIHIESERHHIVVEDCHITYWGRIGGPKSYGNPRCPSSGIYADKGAGHLIIQRNMIETPRGNSNSWETGHPSGPRAISLKNSIGGNIIRYNDLVSTSDHSYNDIFGGKSNFSKAGCPNRDSDIYGNIFRSAHDDAIESEGANMNVRIWGNYIYDTFQFIATASTSKGPLYIFRNVFGTSRKSRLHPAGGAMIKTGTRGELGGGRKYVFHNTALQPDGPRDVFSGHADPNCITRNNIFYCPGRLASSRPVDVPGDYDYDLFTGLELGNAREPNRVTGGTPEFIESYGLEFYPKATIEKVQYGKVKIQIGDKKKSLHGPVMTVPNPVIDSGIPLDNFNDDYYGKAPDLGAFELGNPPLKFGRRANSNGWAPWELY